MGCPWMQRWPSSDLNLNSNSNLNFKPEKKIKEKRKRGGLGRMGQPRELGTQLTPRPDWTEPIQQRGKNRKINKKAEAHCFSTAQVRSSPLFSESCDTLKEKSSRSESATDPTSGEAPVVLR